jgi:hypothetical protein
VGGRLAIALLAASATASWGASPLRAQARTQVVVPRPLLALALNELSFGAVFPGIPTSVSVHDPRRAGLFQIQGPADAAVRVELVLPSALTAEHGALLPVHFGPGDGFADFSRGRPPRGLRFDPHAPVVGSLGPNGSLYLRIGGTALPGRPQAGGEYRATIFMTVYDLGT